MQLQPPAPGSIGGVCEELWESVGMVLAKVGCTEVASPQEAEALMDGFTQ
eukprot:gene5399-33000_t